MAPTRRSAATGPEWARRDLDARFAVLDHFHARGLVSELVEHVLFGPESGLDACLCTRCAYLDAEVTR